MRTIVTVLENATAGIGIWGMAGFHIYCMKRLLGRPAEFADLLAVARSDLAMMQLKPGKGGKNAAAAKDFAGFWGDLARETLLWKKPFTRTLDELSEIRLERTNARIVAGSK